MSSIWDVLVIGGGPAGLLAAWSAKHHSPSARVLVCERQNRFGGKLWVSGGGRCNLSHSAPLEELLEHYQPQPKFLYPALGTFGDPQVRSWFIEQGLPLVCEDARWYPRTQQAASVVQCLLEACRKRGVRLQPQCEITTLHPQETAPSSNPSGTDSQRPLWEAKTQAGDLLVSRTCILACGNTAFASISSPRAFDLAKGLSLALSPRYSALCALEIHGAERTLCQGLTGVSFEAEAEVRTQTGKLLDRRRGTLLFTHRGLTGPVALDLSRCFGANTPAALCLNLFPGETTQTLVELLAQKHKLHPKAGWLKLLQSIQPALPKSLLQTLLLQNPQLQNLSPQAETGRAQLAHACTHWTFPQAQPVPPQKAMQLIGGIPCRSLQPRTMQLRDFDGLFAVGDQLEIAGDCGGYNLLLAWSTGFIAGRSASTLQVPRDKNMVH